MSRRTRELKRELEVPHDGTSEVFFKYQEVSRARAGDFVGEVIDDSLEIESYESTAPASSVEGKHEEGSVAPPIGRETHSDTSESKGTDPVRIYLRKIGSVALLTREGEVELAKRMEEGERAILRAILGSSLLVREIIRLGDDLKEGKMHASEIVEEEEHDDDEDEGDRERAQEERILLLMAKVRHLGRTHEELRELQAATTGAERRAFEARIHDNRDKLVATVVEMRLNKKAINRLIAKLRILIQEVQEGTPASVMNDSIVVPSTRRNGKKAGENCQPGYNLWSRHQFERCKHGSIKAKIPHVRAERAEGNPAVVEKWHI